VIVLTREKWDKKSVVKPANRDGSGRWTSGPTDWGGNPADLYREKKFLDQLTKCLSGLSPNHANAFTLREIEGADPEIPPKRVIPSERVRPPNSGHNLPVRRRHPHPAQGFRHFHVPPAKRPEAIAETIRGLYVTRGR